MFKKFRRELVFVGLLGSAVGVPLLSSSAPDAGSMFGKLGKIGDWFGAALTEEEMERQAHSPPASGDPVPPLAISKQVAPLEGIPVQRLEDVIRFDISPQWVFQRWSRKTTALSDLEFHGIRVPLVTGTGIADLAGSLTYYFNQGSGLERISFSGRTGDPRRLIGLVRSQFGLLPQRPFVAGEDLYQVRWNGQPVSELRIRPASIAWASAPHANYQLDLELQRPGAARYLKKPTPEILPQPLFGAR